MSSQKKPSVSGISERFPPKKKKAEKILSDVGLSIGSVCRGPNGLIYLRLALEGAGPDELRQWNALYARQLKIAFVRLN